MPAATNGENTSAYSFRFEPGEVVACAEGLALPDGRVLKLRIWTSAGRCSPWMKPPTLASDASAPSSRREKSAVHFSLPGPRPKKSEAEAGGATKRTALSLSRSPRRRGGLGVGGGDAQHPAVIVGFCGLVKPTEEEVDAGRLMSLGVVLRQARPVSLFAGFEQETTDLQMSAEQQKVQSETTFQIVLQMRANDIVTSMERAHKLADSLRRKVRRVRARALQRLLRAQSSPVLSVSLTPSFVRLCLPPFRLPPPFRRHVHRSEI